MSTPCKNAHIINFIQVFNKWLLKALLLLFGCSIVSNSLWPHEPQHTRLLYPSFSPWVSSDSCPLSQWCHPTISSSVTLFSSCSQSFQASVYFPMSWLFASCGLNNGTSASVLPMNTQGWFPLGLTGLISLLSKGLSSVSHWLFKILETGKIQLPLQKIKLCVVSCHLQIGFYFFFSDLDSFYFFFFSNCCS